MSIDAISWAFKQSIKPASHKLLLISLADFVNKDWIVWPSIDLLSKFSGLNRKTVITGLNELELAGYISDSGERKGTTSSVKVYIFNHPDSSKPKSEAVPISEGDKQTRKRTEAVPISDGSSTDFGKSPNTPYKEEPLKNLSKNRKYILVDWEKKVGCVLCVEQVMTWVREKQLDPAGVKQAIEEFRDAVTAGGNQYADFTAAFKTWLRNGYLRLKMNQLRVKATGTHGVTFQDKGNSL